MFFYPGCECGGSIDFKLCLPINSMDALGNNQKFMTYLK